MTRRHLMALATGSTAARAFAADAAQRSLYEVRIFRLRNGPLNQRQRTTAFLKQYVPMLKAAGAGPIGAFSASVGESTPYLLVIASFKGFADMEACKAKVAANADYAKALTEWYAKGKPYEREEVRLLRAFPGFPAMTPPPTEGRKSSRMFELRTYQLETSADMERKIKMFDEGETAIFVRAGMLPVFFGETIFGPDMPNLMYMLSFDDLAARESLGRVSGADPAWKTLGAQYPDVATVPELNIAFLSPLAFSDVR